MTTPNPDWSQPTDDDTIPPRSRWVRIGQATVALIALAGLLYLSGIQQYFFFHKTPVNLKQSTLPSKVQGEHLTIPVIVHILSGTVGSERTENDAVRLVDNANQIWHQANISFAIVDYLYPNVTNDDLRRFEHAPYDFISESASHVPGAVNLYLVPTLSGVNGLAYGGTNAVAVADYTTTLDFRTLAHEFGHFLGLDHTSDPSSLMSSGATGTSLSITEIESARQTATR